MKKNSTKSLKKIRTLGVIVMAVSYFVAIQPPVTIASTIIAQGDDFYWSEHALGWQLSCMGGSILFSLLFAIMISIFVIRTLKYSKTGNYFTKSNANLLASIPFIYFLMEFFNSNLSDVLNGKGEIIVSNSMVTPALIIGIFVILYRISYKISEENSLTI